MNGDINIAHGCTQEQRYAARKALFYTAEQDEGYIILGIDGDLPEVEIPIVLTIFPKGASDGTEIVQNEVLNEHINNYNNPHAVTAEQIGAATTEYVDEALGNIPTPDVSGQIATHNADITAHADIREAITNATTTLKNELLNGAGEAYDTLKELGVLIDENSDAIDALEIVATGKADKVHTHTKSEITDFPTSMPASDVSSWAKASSKPTYTASEVGAPTVAEMNAAIEAAIGAALEASY